VRLTEMDEETVRFARHWWAHFGQTVAPSRWLGVPCWQNPFDVWVIQELIEETRPDVVVDTGTFVGGGAILWASLLSLIGDGTVISIDIREGRHAQADDHPLAKERVTFITGSSTDPGIVRSVAASCAGKRTMVILDSDHTASHVSAELDAWAPHVTPGCYLVVQDGVVTYVDADKVPGPLEALGEWLPAHPEFEVDRRRERMLFTFCPSGFLRRT
jgi:cephalosporin hydroxylase